MAKSRFNKPGETYADWEVFWVQALCEEMVGAGGYKVLASIVYSKPLARVTREEHGRVARIARKYHCNVNRYRNGKDPAFWEAAARVLQSHDDQDPPRMRSRGWS